MEGKEWCKRNSVKEMERRNKAEEKSESKRSKVEEIGRKEWSGKWKWQLHKEKDKIKLVKMNIKKQRRKMKKHTLDRETGRA